MRLVQIIPALDEGGVERGTVELSRELVKQGVDSLVISSGGRLVSQLTSQGSRHVMFDVKSKNILTVPVRIVKLFFLLKKIDPDIIHVRSRVPAWLAFIANKWLRKPFITTVHGLNSVNAYSKVMTYGDRVVCASQFMVEHIVKNYHTPREKIVLIPRGVDSHTLSENLDQDFIRQFKSDYELDGQFVICQVARITYLKDQETVIKAFIEVKKVIPEAKLLLVGGYEEKRQNYYQALQQQVSQSGCAADIIFTGNQQQIKEIYALSDVCVSATNQAETFGRANIEALFMNRPLISTRLGAPCDYVFEGKNGFFFEPGDSVKLAELLIKSRSYDFSAEYMRAYVLENFTLEKMVSSNMKLYREVLSQ